MTMDPQAYRIRPIKEVDLDGLFALAQLTGDGFTSLQSDHEFLHRLIVQSVASFTDPSSDRKQVFLLGLEDSRSGQLVGCAAVKTKTGADGSFMNLEGRNGAGRSVLPGHNAQTLTVSDGFSDATEIGTLFLHPDHRRGGVGRLLAKARYLLIASAPEIFGDALVSEIRGVTDGEGVSPFYDALYRDTLGLSFRQADRALSLGGPDYLAAVLPSEPIALASLSPKARSVMGLPHRDAVGAFKLLLSEGFRPSPLIDHFDAGPILSAQLSDVSTLRQATTAMMTPGPQFGGGDYGLMAAGRLQHFRAAIAPVVASDGRAFVAPRTADLLQVDAGTPVRLWTRYVQHSHQPTRIYG